MFNCSLLGLRLSVMIFLVAMLVGPASAQPDITAKLPVNGSLNTDPCGPFGFTFSNASLDTSGVDYVDVLRATGSLTGLRLNGVYTYDEVAKTLSFVPDIPFAPGETVTITATTALTDENGIPLPHGITWHTYIVPKTDDQSGVMLLRDPSVLPVWDDVDLSVSSQNFRVMDITYGDVNYDGDSEIVLMNQSESGDFELMMVEYTNALLWSVKAPELCQVDNPRQIHLVNLDNDRAMELCLLGMRDFIIWHQPASGQSPDSSPSGPGVWYPLNFNANGMDFGDFDGDGDNDLVIFSDYGMDYKIFTNDGNGGFTELVQVSLGSIPNDKSLVATSLKTSVGDLDGDGDLDLMWAAGSQSNNYFWVYVAQGNNSPGDATFLPPKQFAENSSRYPQCLIPFETSGNSETPGGCQLKVARRNSVREYDFDSDLNDSPGFIMNFDQGLERGGLEFSNLFFDTGSNTNNSELLVISDDGYSLFIRQITGGSIHDNDWDLGGNSSFVRMADFDYDGDVDLLVVQSDSKRLRISEGSGGNYGGGPLPQGMPCGTSIDFGTVEADCPTVFSTRHVIFSSASAFPATITAVSVSTANFQVGTYSTQVFSAGCNAASSVVDIEAIFQPTASGLFNDNLIVEYTLAGAGPSGQDLVETCSFPLSGTGLYYSGESNELPTLQLTGDSTNGYLLSDASYDFGDVAFDPNSSGTRFTFRFQSLNGLNFDVGPETPDIAPFLINNEVFNTADNPVWNITLDFMDEPVWGPDGSAVVDVSFVFSANTGSGTDCLNRTPATISLHAVLWKVSPGCLRPDPNCDEVVDAGPCPTDNPLWSVCAEVQSSFCVLLEDWDWPGANPQITAINLPSWCTYSWDTDRHLRFTATAPVGSTGLVDFEIQDSLTQMTNQMVINIDVNDPVAMVNPVGENWYQGNGSNCSYPANPYELLMNSGICLMTGHVGRITVDLVTDPGDVVSETLVVSPLGDLSFPPGIVTLAIIGNQAVLTVDATGIPGNTNGDVSALITWGISESPCNTNIVVQTTVNIIPELPDLVLDGVTVQTDPVQNHSFDVYVEVSALYLPVDGAEVVLTNTGCGGPLTSIVDLAVGVPQTIQFTLPSCAVCGPVEFLASVTHPDGNNNDNNPNNNSFSVSADITCNNPPVIVFESLTLDPFDQNIGNCGPSSGNNDTGNLQSLTVRETSSLSLVVIAVDNDPLDTAELNWAVPVNESWVSFLSNSDDRVVVTLSPPEGEIGADVCREFVQLLNFTATEVGSINPLSSPTEYIDVNIKNNLADLAVELVGAPSALVLGESASVSARVTSHENSMNAFFTFSLVVRAPDGSVVEILEIDLAGLDEGASRELGPIVFTPSLPGNYCLVAEVTEVAEDINAANNRAEQCYAAQAGEFVVLPDLITPNGDGKNDVAYFFFANQITNNPSLAVYSLSGKQVKVTSEFDGEKRLTWDGRDDNSELVQPGTYIYIISDVGKKIHSGRVGVVR